MLSDAMKLILPRAWAPLVVIAAALVWLGWTSAEAASTLKKHYSETTELVRITKQICKATNKLAGIDPKVCD